MVNSRAAPAWQLGYLSPLPVVDAMHYEFYQAVPKQGVFLAYPLVLASFSEASARDAAGNAPRAIDYLKSRGAGRIVFGGIPLSALLGRPSMLRMMRDEEQRTGIRVTSDFEDCIEALAFLSVRRVAVAAKWKPPIMEAVARYLAEAGIEVLGMRGADYDAREVMVIDTLKSVELGVELGRSALASFPEAQALLLGGGTWLSIPISVALEREFGKPVVSNMSACFWNALRQFGESPAIHEGCALLAGRRQT